MPSGRKPKPPAVEILSATLTCTRLGCLNRARYEITDDGQAWQKVCSEHFFHWNGTLPVPAILAQPRQ